MTTFTNRFDLKWFGIIRMMILLCLFWAIFTLQSIGVRYFASNDSITNNISSFVTIGIFLPMAITCKIIYYFTCITLLVSIMDNFGFCRIPISFSDNFAIVRFSILSCVFNATYSAFITIAIFRFLVFIKLRNWLNFFALGTFFRYDFNNHNQLLYSWLRLEPVSGYVPVSGSFYNITKGGKVK